MALTNWGDILNKPKAIENVDELAVSVSDLSASVLTIENDIEKISDDIVVEAIQFPAYSINSNEMKTLEITIPTKTGYKPEGVISWSMDGISGTVVIYINIVSLTLLKFRLLNILGSENCTGGNISIIYKKIPTQATHTTKKTTKKK